ncbi:MAG: oxidoreductase [Anaeromyxobacteraceae bacterium]
MARSRLTALAPLAAALTLACARPPDGATASSADGLGGGRPPRAPTVTAQASGTPNGLIAVSAVNDRVAWAAGRAGTYAVTTDGGDHWRAGVVPGAEALQFRDVEAVSARTAYLLSIGTGTDSRIYRTEDGGATWAMQFQNTNPDAFYDCFAFWGRDRGFAMSDSVAGVWPFVRTLDGTSWQSIAANMPPALPGEAGFASSGTCAATQGRRNGWFVTGGVAPARIIATRDGGESWTAYTSPIPGSPSGGNFSVAFRDGRHGAVAGGDLDPAAPPAPTFATSADGGATWTARTNPPVGVVFGIAYVSGDGRGDGDDEDGDDDGGPYRRAVVATGPGGTAWSTDEGATWQAIPDVTGCWATTFSSPRAGWLACTGGRIFKVSF